MNKEEIIIEISKKVDKDINQIDESMSFTNDLNLDSIDLVEMLMDIEEKYGIEIPDEEAIKIETIGDFIKIVQDKGNE